MKEVQKSSILKTKIKKKIKYPKNLIKWNRFYWNYNKSKNHQRNNRKKKKECQNKLILFLKINQVMMKFMKCQAEILE